MGFDPFTAAIIIGTGVQVYGTYAGGQAAKKEARFQAGIARNNAKIGKMQAKDIVAGGLVSAKQLESDAIRFADDQLLGFAGSGIDVTSGVAVTAVEDTARLTAADIIELEHNIARDVWATELGIAGSLSEAQLLGIRARNAERIANINIASTIIGAGIGASRRSSNASLPGGI